MSGARFVPVACAVFHGSARQCQGAALRPVPSRTPMGVDPAGPPRAYPFPPSISDEATLAEVVGGRHDQPRLVDQAELIGPDVLGGRIPALSHPHLIHPLFLGRQPEWGRPEGRLRE